MGKVHQTPSAKVLGIHRSYDSHKQSEQECDVFSSLCVVYAGEHVGHAHMSM